MNERIPRIIHYCWFGGNPLPESAQKCIASWRKFCPDYRIMEWSEKNIDLSSVAYMREAYEEKAWGFVPDVARLQIIYQYGGIYLDTDVEIVRSLNPLLQHEAFMGFEDGKFVALGLGFGAMPGNPLIAELLEDYNERHFRNVDGTLDRTSAPTAQTVYFLRNGMVQNNKKQIIKGAVIYPSEYFCPQSYKTGILTLTENTYSIHHYDGSWLTEEEKCRVECRYQIYQTWGPLAPLVWLLVRINRKIKKIGFFQTVKLIFIRLFQKMGFLNIM